MILARSHNTWMLVEGEGYLSLMGKPSAFQYDFGA
jgi:hypothetical protein